MIIEKAIERFITGNHSPHLDFDDLVCVCMGEFSPKIAAAIDHGLCSPIGSGGPLQRQQDGVQYGRQMRKGGDRLCVLNEGGLLFAQ